MAIYAIADTHLSGSVPKSMEKFGRRWTGYADKLERRWRALVTDADTVVIPGDVSWAMTLPEATADLRFLASLPGKKLIGKGNHDFWWSTVTKMQKFLEQNAIHGIEFLYNNAYDAGSAILCGTRGWPFEEDFADPHNEKIFKRELLRLEASLKLGAAADPEEILCFLHYPPLYASYRCGEIIELLHKYGVKRCIYGHLHGKSLSHAVTGEQEGIEWKLVSGDFVDFIPIFLKK